MDQPKSGAHVGLFARQARVIAGNSSMERRKVSWRGHIAALDVEGARVRVRAAGIIPIVAEVTAAVGELRLDQGCEVWVSVKATEIRTYAA